MKKPKESIRWKNEKSDQTRKKDIKTYERKPNPEKKKLTTPEPLSWENQKMIQYPKTRNLYLFLTEN